MTSDRQHMEGMGEMEDLEDLEDSHKEKDSSISSISSISSKSSSLYPILNFSEEFLKSRLKKEKMLYILYQRGFLKDSEVAEILKENCKVVSKFRYSLNSRSLLVERKDDERPASYGLSALGLEKVTADFNAWSAARENAAVLAAERLKRESFLSDAERDRAKATLTLVSEFLLAHQGLILGDALVLDLAEVANFNPDLAEDLLSNPLNTLQAFRSVLESEHDAKPELFVRNLPESAQKSLKDLRAEDEGRLFESIVEVESCTESFIVHTKITFRCPECGSVIVEPQRGLKLTKPSACKCGYKGRGRLGWPVLSEERQDQIIVYVTQPLSELQEAGFVRTKKKLYLVGGLTDPDKFSRHLTPGNFLRVVYFPRSEPKLNRDGSPSTASESLIYALWLEPVQDFDLRLDFKPEDIDDFKSKASEKDFISRASESIFKRHYGDAHIKKAVFLQAFAGDFQRKTNAEDLHILLVGDPGLGKTENFLIPAAKELNSIGSFVEATKTSGPGLIGSAGLKDEFTGRQLFEPGALTRCNRGLVALDEFSNLSPEDMKGLNEAMQSKTITINKASVRTQAPADVRILAAMNPPGGRFKGGATASSCLAEIDPSTSNRFGLIFPMMDVRDPVKDRQIGQAILKFRGAEGEFANDWLASFVKYARHYVHPVLGKEEEEAILSFYGFLRDQPLYDEANSRAAGVYLVMGARQLNALRALTLLHAKANLREYTVAEDVKVAIGLFEPMLRAFNFDLSGLERWLVCPVCEICARPESGVGVVQ